MSAKRLAQAVSTGAIILALGACSSIDTGGRKLANADDIKVVGHSETNGMDPIAAAAFWGTRYDRDPGNGDVAVAFSKSLRAVDNNEESLRVIRQAAIRLPDHPDVSLELGKSLIANDRAHEAVRPIEQSIAMGKTDDWSAYSAYGVALDKIGEHARAQAQYDRALMIAPDQPQVLNNKGLSYALQGNKDRAERTLRAATHAPGGTARIRQNFALVLAMAGNKTEAERLARSDLPPSVADRNVAYYRNLVAQPVYWQDLSKANVEQPDFGDDDVSTTPRATPVPEPVPSPTPGRRQPQPEQPAKEDPKAEGQVSAAIEGEAAPMALAFQDTDE